MRDAIELRALRVSEYIVEHGATVRDAAKRFSVSKSTVFKDVTDRVASLDSALARDVRAVLDRNRAERHLRGGWATREKYQIMSKSCQKL